MADDSDSSGEFSGFSPQESIVSSDDLRDIETDVSVSDISTTSSTDLDEFEGDTSDVGEGELGAVASGPQNWTSMISPISIPDFTGINGASFQLPATASEIDFFVKFFPDSLLESVVVETNRYASQAILKKPDPLWRPLELSELKAFLGLHVLLSVIQMPSHKLAWTTNRLFRHPAMGEIMTRSRFEHILRYFHVNDASQNPARGEEGHDRLCLIRPLIEEIGKLCVENYLPSKESSIDEAMIAYKGRLSFKQYLPAKPTKFGVKVWVRADPNNGYVNEFDIYTGKSAQAVAADEGGLGARVVKKLRATSWSKPQRVYGQFFLQSTTIRRTGEERRLLLWHSATKSERSAT